MITLNTSKQVKNNNFIHKKNQNFKGSFLYKTADLFIKSQENLSSTRFIQDTITNWCPKAIFSRSKEDFAEMSFLEFLESGIFYFASPILGEKVFRNGIFKNITPKPIRETVNKLIPQKAEEILNNKTITDTIKKRTIATKAGIVLACTAIPVAEYTLSFAKNLFTLKTFKKSNFNNIANLNKSNTEEENPDQQRKVEINSKKELKKGAIISLVGISSGIILSLAGHKSDKLQKVSQAILEPGQAIAKNLKSDKLKKSINKFSLDFANNNGKLALSKGQLALTAILGLFGYSKAAEDRGKLDKYEVWTRVPLVVFYTIFGSELFEKGYTKILEKKNLFPDLIKKAKDGSIKIPQRCELLQIAENISKLKNTSSAKELKKLTKEKALIAAVPYTFSLLFMGFSLSAITRLWTQYRYNHSDKKQNKNTYSNVSFGITNNKLPEVYKIFKN